MLKRKILIDCDPGHDDAVAIMLASASKELEILGVTTVAGNQTVDKTFINARRVLALIKKNVPVACGFARPLFRKLVTAEHIHGKTGLDGAELPPPVAASPEPHAVNFITQIIQNINEKVYIIATGPLTNIAVFLLLATENIKAKIEKIIIMGGGVYASNVTPAAEFNIFVDPEAARIVFESGLPITMVGLDVTNRALLTYDDIRSIEALNGRVSSVVAKLLAFYAHRIERVFGIKGAPLHDAVAVAAAIKPNLLKTDLLHVDIETSGEFTRGATVVDVNKVTEEKPNAEVAFDIDVPAFKELIFRAISDLDKRWT